MEKNLKKNICKYIYVYIYINESLCCIPETTVNQLYLYKKRKKIKEVKKNLKTKTNNTSSLFFKSMYKFIELKVIQDPSTQEK